LLKRKFHVNHSRPLSSLLQDGSYFSSTFSIGLRASDTLFHRLAHHQSQMGHPILHIQPTKPLLSTHLVHTSNAKQNINIGTKPNKLPTTSSASPAHSNFPYIDYSQNNVGFHPIQSGAAISVFIANGAIYPCHLDMMVPGNQGHGIECFSPLPLVHTLRLHNNFWWFKSLLPMKDGARKVMLLLQRSSCCPDSSMKFSSPPPMCSRRKSYIGSL
jgi:hypothetical protein